LSVNTITVLARGLALSVAAIALAGCAVGPDFVRPDAPQTDSYTEEPVPQQTVSADTVGGAAQTFAQGKDIQGDWWTLYHSQDINDVVGLALKGNPDLEAAQASLREARANWYVALGPLFPQIDATGGVTRERLSAAGSGGMAGKNTFTLYNASVQGSYLLDIWGGSRRELEAAGAREDFARFELEGTYLTLTSNVVTGAIQEASLRSQVAATNDIIKAEAQELNVLQQQFNLGAISEADVLSQQAQLAQTKATLPGLDKALAAQRNHLATLIGRVPSQGNIPAFDLTKLTLPQEIPLSIPSKLVEQRPDVRAAEGQMHAALAEVGVATANLLPQFDLTANYGGEAFSASKLFNAPNITWGLGASVLQAIFHGGSLWHAREAAKAEFDRTYAAYKSTVLAAFEDVANSLRALQADADTLKADLEAERAAAGRLHLVQEQFQAGAVAYLSVLDAERTEQQARITLVQGQAARFADTAALFHSLGGGWWNNPAPTGDEDKDASSKDAADKTAAAADTAGKDDKPKQ